MSKFRVYITVENPSIKLENKFLDYIQPKAQPGGLKGLKPPPSDQNIDAYFLSFSLTLYYKSRSGALQNVL